MDARKVIDALGGTAATARLCDIQPPSVSEWKRNNEIPKARLMYLRAVRPDAFKPVGRRKAIPASHHIAS